MRRFLPLLLIVSGCPPRHPDAEPDSARVAETILAVLDSRVDAGEAHMMYGCDPAEWALLADRPGELADLVVRTGTEKRDAPFDSTAPSFCHSTHDGLSCCASAFESLGRDPTDVARLAPHAASTFLVACAPAPGGYQGYRGCLNYVALSRYLQDPVDRADRIRILEAAIEAGRSGKAD